jgi:hypothetical protein
MKLNQRAAQQSPVNDDFLDDQETPIDNDDEANDIAGDDLYSDIEASPSTMQKYSDLIKDLTNFNPILKEVVNSWLGIGWNEKQQRYDRIDGVVPLMNIAGAMWCISYLKTYAKKTNLITNLNEEEYKWLYLDINRVVWG